MAKSKFKVLEETIRSDLVNQLHANNKFGKHYEDLVDDYIYYFRLKDLLQKDIRKKGLRYEASTGNGHASLKPNESVQNVLKVTSQMLKILNDLGMQEPMVVESSGDNVYLPGD